MSLKIFLPTEKRITDEEGWKDYHETVQDLEKQIELRKMATATKIFERCLPKEGRILDAGCGNGAFLVHFKERDANKFFGIDFNMIALHSLKQYDESQSVLKGDVTSLPYRDCAFSAVISQGVVEHFEQGPMKALKEYHRVLKPGSLLFCSVPFANLLRYVIYPVYVGTYWFVFGRVKTFIEWRYSKKEMVNFCKKAGFKIRSIHYVDLEPKNFSFFWAVDFGSLLRKRKSNIPFELNRVGTIFKDIFRPFPAFQAGGIMVVGEKL